MYAKRTKRHICRRGRLFALGVACCALLIDGCGSAAKPSSTGTSTAYAQGVKYSDCMRSDGVPNYPDPDTGGNDQQQTSAVNQQSPAYQSAQRACAPLHPGNNATPTVISGAQRAAMIANALCIRKHGVPSFPDPRFGRGDGVEVGVVPNQADSPAFKQAVKTCEHVGIPLPGVG